VSALRPRSVSEAGRRPRALSSLPIPIGLTQTPTTPAVPVTDGAGSGQAASPWTRALDAAAARADEEALPAAGSLSGLAAEALAGRIPTPPDVPARSVQVPLVPLSVRC
jgi:hypothetical protein